MLSIYFQNFHALFCHLFQQINKFSAWFLAYLIMIFQLQELYGDKLWISKNM
jgi:hypothetical protein